ncbi:MAG: MBOAT family protein [Bacteroidales bacterium]|nr:MBOAT family protein [Bacteroidales bacterium]
MLFNSLEFIFFLPAVVALYFLLPHRFRWILLVIASYYFYMCANVKYVALLFAATIICYLSAIWISRSANRLIRNGLLILTLILLLGPLFFYKYFNFFSGAFNSTLEQFNIFYKFPYHNFLLPVGISFYTFQALGYTIDVYRGNIQPEYHLGKFAVFTSFFPQLLAGPIGRAASLMPQFEKKISFNYTDIRDGLTLMIWGFFKKVVIADRLSEYVNMVYDNPQAYDGGHYLIATLFFAVQIYCDFSGYTDIARVSARMMGINLMLNFKLPYLATSIREFWQRWHISLTTWFRDYIFLPISIAISRKIEKEKVLFIKTDLFIYIIASAVTWFVTGLWHGANYTFIVWGLIHGFFLVMYQWLHKKRIRVQKKIGIRSNNTVVTIIETFVTFFIVTFTWIFFRANTISDAFMITGKIFDFSAGHVINLFKFPADFYIAFISIGLLLLIEILEEYNQLVKKLHTFIRPVKWAILIALVLAVFILGKWDSADFLYFQF